jgi:RNA polymerase sigma factor for flagellar operon FliA
MCRTEVSPEVLQLVREGLELTKVIARRLTRTMGKKEQLDDAIAYGNEAVLDVARRYDPHAGFTFRAFASPRIEGAMIDGLRKMAPVPRRAHEKLSAEKPDGRERLLFASLATARATGLLVQPAFDTQGEHLAVSALASAEEESLRKAVIGILERGIDSLPPDEAALIRGHYLEGKQFELLAKELGLSAAWVSRLKDRALERLAKLLAVDFKSRV